MGEHNLAKIEKAKKQEEMNVLEELQEPDVMGEHKSTNTKRETTKTKLKGQ